MSLDSFVRSHAHAGSLHGSRRATAGLLRFRPHLLLLLVAFVLFAARAHAQLDTSTITGTVTDQTGAVVPGATVSVIDAKTNRTFTTTTNAKGEYTAPFLSVSVYQVKVSKKGFRTTTIDGIVLHANDSVGENVVLEVGSVSESVTVQADEIQADTETTSLGTTITADEVSQLPTNGRDIMDMLALVPGSVQNTGSAVNGDSMGGFATGQFGANVLLDGGDSTRVDGNLAFSTWGISTARITRSSIDNVQEVKVLSSDYSAEYGRSVGDIINIITKSGTNNLHGEAFEFLRNDALDSKNYANSTGLSVPLRLNQFGANVGGPILRDKLFFFGNYEGDRQRVTNVVIGTSLVLNDAMRAKAVPAIKPIIDLLPEGSKDANGNYIPAIITDQGVNYGYWFNQLTGTTYKDMDENTYALKLDYVSSQKNNFAARYNYNYSDTYGTYGLAKGQYENGRQLSQLGKGTWNYTGSESLLNELGFNINSPRTVQQPGEQGMPSFGCFFCSVGLGMTPSPDGMAFGAQAPNMSYELIDTATKIKGRHQFRFGTDMRWNGVGRSITSREGITFFGGDYVAAAGSGGGPEGMLSNNGVAYSVMGYPLNWTHNANYDFFFNDIVKVRRNFSMNMGIRYEFNTVLHDSKEAFRNFSLATMSLEPAGTQLYNPSHVDWAPRVGFNWDPFNKGMTTVKGGFGLFFMPVPAGTANNLASNTQLNENVNLLEIGWLGTEKCTPEVTTITYPLPTTLPDCTEAGAKSVTLLAPNMRDSYAEQWSFSLDQQIAKNTVLTIAYRGNHGLRLPSGYNANIYEANSDNTAPTDPNNLPARVLTDKCTKAGGTDAECQWGDISYNNNFASSNYNALNVSVRANTHGLSLNANYNWSHEFDDNLGLFEAYQNPYDIHADWSQGDIDVRNTFAVGAVYNAPRIPIRFTRLATGWQVSTITQGRSGSPVNFGYTFTDNTTDYAATSLRPDCVPGVSWRATNWSHSNQFNAAAFKEPALAWGNCPRNYGRGPTYIQPDMALVKNTKLTEHLNWEFRGEVFNFPNHPNFANPVSSVNGYLFGDSFNTIGDLVGQGTSRQIQFSTKLTF